MENKETKKPIPVELDDDALNEVSGGIGAIMIDPQTSVTSDNNDLMSGSMLR